METYKFRWVAGFEFPKPNPRAVAGRSGSLLINARGAIERGDPQAALALLARVKSARRATEREELRRLARAAQDGGP